MSSGTPGTNNCLVTLPQLQKELDSFAANLLGKALGDLRTSIKEDLQAELQHHHHQLHHAQHGIHGHGGGLHSALRSSSTPHEHHEHHERVSAPRKSYAPLRCSISPGLLPPSAKLGMNGSATAAEHEVGGISFPTKFDDMEEHGDARTLHSGRSEDASDSLAAFGRFVDSFGDAIDHGGLFTSGPCSQDTREAEEQLLSGSPEKEDATSADGDNDDLPIPRDTLGMTLWTEESLASAPKPKPKESRLQTIVKHPAFEVAGGCLIVINGVLIGLETEFKMSGSDLRLHEILRHSETLFCLCFTTEWFMRMLSVGLQEFFCGSQVSWNWFDTSMVFIQITDQIRTLQEENHVRVTILQMFRLLRLIRIARLFRLVRFVSDLRTIFNSMFNAFSALVWTLMLLFLILYILAIFCCQVIYHVESRYGYGPHHDDLHYWFGSLGRAMLSLFECIAGGVSWDEVINPLITDIHPAMALVFCSYIIVTCYAVTNMMTGMFVDKAMQFCGEDRDNSLAHRIRDLVFRPDADGNVQDVTWERFADMLNEETMKDYFKVLNVDTSEARGFFDLLDEDGGGELDAAELVSGCLRLRGPAKALDLSLLAREVFFIKEIVSDMSDSVEQALAGIKVADDVLLHQHEADDASLHDRSSQ